MDAINILMKTLDAWNVEVEEKEFTTSWSVEVACLLDRVALHYIPSPFAFDVNKYYHLHLVDSIQLIVDIIREVSLDYFKLVMQAIQQFGSFPNLINSSLSTQASQGSNENFEYKAIHLESIEICTYYTLCAYFLNHIINQDCF